MTDKSPGSRTRTRAGWLALLLAVFLPALASSVHAGTLYVTYRGSGDLIAVDEDTLAVRERIAVGEQPWGVALTPDGRWACVSADGVLAVVDTNAAEVVRRVALDGQGMGVAGSADGDTCYVAVHRPGPDRLLAVKRESGEIRAQAEIGERAFGLYRSPEGGTLFVPEHDDFTLTFFALPALEKRRTLELHPAGRGAYDKPHYLAVSPGGDRLYLPFQGESLAVVDTRTFALDLHPLDVNAHQHGIAVSPDGARVYVANSPLGGGGSLSVVDAKTFEELRRIRLGRGHEQVLVSDDGRRAYLTGGFALGGHDGLTVVDLETGAVTLVDAGGEEPFHIVRGP